MYWRIFVWFFIFQEWVFTFTASKTTLHFIFAHKWYFQDLIDDWSAKSPPDLLYFVPYTWKFQFICKKFELVTSGNEYNWIDTSSTNQENALLAVCGEHLNLKFDLPSAGKYGKIQIFWEGHKNLNHPSLFWHCLVVTNLSGRWAKIFWSAQNI